MNIFQCHSTSNVNVPAITYFFNVDRVVCIFLTRIKNIFVIFP